MCTVTIDNQGEQLRHIRLSSIQRLASTAPGEEKSNNERKKKGKKNNRKNEIMKMMDTVEDMKLQLDGVLSTLHELLLNDGDDGEK